MSKQNSLGAINYDHSTRKSDYLYRVTVKGLIRNDRGEVLVVKETGRTWWDLPGGGMDHGEDIKLALVRELKEEVDMNGDFSYRIISADPPAYLKDVDIWQVRLIFVVEPAEMSFAAGEDGDEIAFMSPDVFKDSSLLVERKIFEYANIASEH